MNSIIDIAENLITDVKENQAFSNVTFVKAYSVYDYNPSYGGFTAVVNIDEVERSEGYLSRLYKADTYGDIFFAKLIVRLYAGNNTSGDSLTKTALSLKQSILSADSDGFINKSKIGPIKYESDTAAVYREISFDIEYVLCEAII